tara:strand:+ start:62616 stop:62807 length:192 start_codon:yes stop_codon:yes gene_type:complete
MWLIPLMLAEYSVDPEFQFVLKRDYDREVRERQIEPAASTTKNCVYFSEKEYTQSDDRDQFSG